MLCEVAVRVPLHMTVQHPFDCCGAYGSSPLLTWWFVVLDGHDPTMLIGGLPFPILMAPCNLV